MERMLEKLIEKEHFAGNKMAFVVGPRQVGKTTLALSLLEKYSSINLYKNWDDLEWRREYTRSPYSFIDGFIPQLKNRKPLVVFDEIHKNPGWKNFVKGLYDTRNKRVNILVTGSARLDVYQRGGDSLLGRYHQYRLHPLSVAELVSKKTPDLDENHSEVLKNLLSREKSSDKQNSVLDDLLTWGGFPETFLTKKIRFSRKWIAERRRLLIREDLRDISRIQMISHVEQLAEMLVLRAGSLVSFNSLREDIQVNMDTITKWMNVLSSLYFIYLIRPYAGKVQRALKRGPKLYLWDWSEIEEEGKKFENLMASHLLKWSHFTEDWGLEPLELRFIRDKEKREVDFLILRKGKPWILIEAKLSRTSPGKNLLYFAEKLKIKNVFQVCRKRLEKNGFAGDVRVMDAASFLGALPV